MESNIPNSRPQYSSNNRDPFYQDGLNLIAAKISIFIPRVYLYYLGLLTGSLKIVNSLFFKTIRRFWINKHEYTVKAMLKFYLLDFGSV